MIRQIRWAESDYDESKSPFLQRHKDRKLKITFHSENLKNATGEDLKVLNSLRSFSKTD